MRSFFEFFNKKYPQLHWSKLQILMRHFQSETDLDMACQKILQGHPLEYLIEQASWGPLEFKILEPLLIPRDETWFWLENFYKKHLINNKNLSVLDLGCGPGTLSLGIHHLAGPHTQITALDINPLACETTRMNFLHHQIHKSSVFESNWLDILIQNQHPMRYDVILSNPPYCDHSTQFWSESSVEDPRARFAHFGGLEPYITIFQQSKIFLKHNGFLIVEHGSDQVPALVILANQIGYEYVESFWDFIPRLRASLFIKKGA